MTAIRELYGLFGYPVDHSLSPDIQAAAFDVLGRPAAYLAFPVEPGHLPSAFTAARTLGVKGFNVTIPHKEEAAKLVDQLAGDAVEIEAVNCVVREEGQLVGHNTDTLAVRVALERMGADFSGQRVLVIGAGGAARAAAHALGRMGASEVVIANRTFSRARALCAMLTKLGIEAVPSPFSAGALREIVPMSQVVVNATSIGLKAPEQSPLPMDVSFAPDAIAIDLVYRPLFTRFLEQARDQGARTVDGLEILVHQAIGSLSLWFDETLDDAHLVPVMRAAAMELLS